MSQVFQDPVDIGRVDATWQALAVDKDRIPLGDASIPRMLLLLCGATLLVVVLGLLALDCGGVFALVEGFPIELSAEMLSSFVPQIFSRDSLGLALFDRGCSVVLPVKKLSADEPQFSPL